MVKLKRMFLDGRTPQQIQEAEARAHQQADLRVRRQDAVLHHDFDKMRREVESLGEPLTELLLLCLYVWVLMHSWPTWQLASRKASVTITAILHCTDRCEVHDNAACASLHKAM